MKWTQIASISNETHLQTSASLPSSTCLHPSLSLLPLCSSLPLPPHSITTPPSSIFLRYFPLVMSHLLPSPDISVQEKGSRIWTLNFKYAFYLLGMKRVVNGNGGGGVCMCEEEYDKRNFNVFFITFLPAMLFVSLHNQTQRHSWIPQPLLSFQFSSPGFIRSTFSICCQSNLSKNNINDYEIKIA